MPNGPMKRLLEDIRQRVREGAKFCILPDGEIRHAVTHCCPKVVADGETDPELNDEAGVYLRLERNFTFSQAKRFVNAADHVTFINDPKTAALRRVLLRACGLESEVK